jgi:hypothetical protein
MIREIVLKLIMYTKRVDEHIASKQFKPIASTANTETRNSSKI